MTKTEAKPVAEIVNALFSNGPDRLREIVRAVMQEMLEAEMTDALSSPLIKSRTLSLATISCGLPMLPPTAYVAWRRGTDFVNGLIAAIRDGSGQMQRAIRVSSNIR
jgi:hypothetical protein